MNYKFQTDRIFTIGRDHKVCQDYAYSGGYNGVPYIIVSDGCSASKDSDVGARLVAHSFRAGLFETIRRFISPFGGQFQKPIDEVFDYLYKNILTHMQRSVENLQLDYSVLDATLIACFIVDDNLYECIYGDGCIIKKFRDGNIEATSFSYDTNAPYYLSYQLDDKRNEQYKKEFGNGLIKSTTYKSNNVVDIKINTIENFFNIRVYNNIGKDLEMIMIGSDGLCSFMNETGNIPFQNIYPEIINIKNYNGVFLQRKMNFFNKENEKKGIYHYDDVSLNVLRIIEESIEEPCNLPK